MNSLFINSRKVNYPGSRGRIVRGWTNKCRRPSQEKLLENTANKYSSMSVNAPVQPDVLVPTVFLAITFVAFELFYSNVSPG